jgi:hypothetical protein
VRPKSPCALIMRGIAVANCTSASYLGAQIGHFQRSETRDHFVRDFQQTASECENDAQQAAGPTAHAPMLRPYSRTTAVDL